MHRALKMLIGAFANEHLRVGRRGQSPHGVGRRGQVLAKIYHQNADKFLYGLK